MHKLKPVHPGEILLEEFLGPLGSGNFALAKQLNLRPAASMKSCMASAAFLLTRICVCAGISACRRVIGCVVKFNTTQKWLKTHWLKCLHISPVALPCLNLRMPE